MASGRRENRSRSGKGFRELMRFDCWPLRKRFAFGQDAAPTKECVTTPRSRCSWDPDFAFPNC
jgi:hypothetical protein